MRDPIERMKSERRIALVLTFTAALIMALVRALAGGSPM